MLASSSGLPHEVLEVSFGAVDDFLERVDPSSFERLLMIGVAQKAEKMRIELVGRNTIGATPDVRGEVHGPGLVDPAEPFQFGGTLWRETELLQENEEWMPSVDAGSYLCNYIYFRALQRFPGREVGFLHVPPLEVVGIEEQQEVFTKVLDVLKHGQDARATHGLEGRANICRATICRPLAL